MKSSGGYRLFYVMINMTIDIEKLKKALKDEKRREREMERKSYKNEVLARELLAKHLEKK